jgi:hypothetical protein
MAGARRWANACGRETPMAKKVQKKVKIKDLPLNKKVTAKDLKAVSGGKKPGKKVSEV